MNHEVEASVGAVERTAEGFRATLRFDAGLDVFRGHFPGYPIVPGVYLVEAVRVAAERATGRPLAIARVRDAKFTAEVPPGEKLTLEATLDEELKCSATATTRTGTAATIVLRLR